MIITIQYIMLSFDQLLTSRIGLGPYQYVQCLQIAIMNFISGMQIIGISIFTRVLFIQWAISQKEVIKITSSIFIGAFIAQVFCLLLADKIGRQKILIAQVFMAGLCYFAMAFTHTTLQMSLLWLATGFTWVCLMILTNIIMPEMIIQSYRGIFALSSQIMTVLGILFEILLCIIFMGNLSSPRWRDVMFINSFICFVLFAFMIFCFDESPRFLLCLGRFDDAFQGINRMILKNHSSQLLTSEEVNHKKNIFFKKDQLRNWQKKEMSSYLLKNNFVQLFQAPQTKITIMLCFIGMLYMYQVNCLIFLLPLFYGQETQGLWVLFFTYCLELPFAFLTSYFIDKKNIGGRIRIFILAMLFMAGADFLIFVIGKKALLIGAIIMKSFERVVWSCLFLLGSESFTTVLRTTGASLVGAFGKGCMMMLPAVLFGFYGINQFLPFFFMGIACILNVMLLCFFPDKTAQPLDQNNYEIMN